MNIGPQDQVQPSEPPLVWCVLLNWNGWRDTNVCLKSLARQEFRNLRVCVVDNGSTDDSISRIRLDHPGVELIEAGRNLGFAGGCNAGIRFCLEAGAEFIWLLNNDTSAPPDTLTKLVRASQRYDAGIVGTVLMYMDDPESVQAWGGGRIRLWNGFVSHFTAPAELGANSFLTFASVLIRRQLLVEIGFLDEGYFMYFDDSEFCFRARRAGWRLAVAEDTAVLHRVSGSAHSRTNLGMQRIVTASGLRFLRDYSPTPATSMFFFLSSKVAKRLFKGDFASIRAVFLGLSDWWNGMRTSLKESA